MPMPGLISGAMDMGQQGSVSTLTGGETTVGLLTVPLGFRARLTDMRLMTDAGPTAPIKARIEVGGVVVWVGMLNAYAPLFWTNNLQQITAEETQTIALILGQTPAVQTVAYDIGIVQSENRLPM